ncbi:MAG TPA: FAD-dependent oxidoreductase [Candidatus Competibacteraceae bacterium]|nr:MAG: NAD(P)/FAD-dependent oxidoreductase [Candidatus Competibacteraceae bacterium]HNW78265.1 FAD-dependent oxidoreductase [Candidatus Competibacteraceae bacterium]
MHRITILGAGFAALTAVQRIRAQAPTAEITLVAPHAEFLFYPSLIWIPSGLRRGADLQIDLRPFLTRQRVHWHPGTVTGLASGGRQVLTDTGIIDNDGLIIASGGRFLKRLPGIEHALIPCEGLASAEAIRDRLQALEGGTLAIGFAGNPNEPAAVRGGPMFEFLFGIDRLLRQQGRRERFKLVFFSPAEQPGQRMGPPAVARLLRMMAEQGIETHLGHKMLRFTADQVVTEGGAFAADLILFMPGMTGPAWLEQSELPQSPGGMIRADEQCRVPGWERVYVAGDSGSFPGPEWMPKQAHIADLQACAAAANLLAELAGQTPNATFKTELICIVDMLDRGMLIWRTPERLLTLPPMRLGHQAKRFFEWWYLRQYR